RFDRSHADVDPEPFPPEASGEARGLDPDRIPAAPLRLRDQETDPAAEIAEGASFRVALDSPERAIGGCALASLLVEVRALRHLTIAFAQILLVRELGNLHVAALAAAQYVCGRGPVGGGGGDEVQPVGR